MSFQLRSLSMGAHKKDGRRRGALGIEAAEGDLALLAELAVAEEDAEAGLRRQAAVDDDVEGAKVPAGSRS